jgi:phage gp29-like protein
MSSLKERVTQFFRDLIPVQRVTVLDSRHVPSAIAHTMTVDRVHQILRDAEAGNTESLFALYRDIILAHAHLQGRFADRKRAVLGDTVNLQPFDKKSEADQAAANALWPVTRHRDWMEACSHLLDATLYPVAVVEKVFRPSTVPGMRYELARLVPVPHDLLDFQLGRLRIRETDERGQPISTYREPDPHRYIVHRGHLLTTTPDHWGGPMRSLIFWWLLATMDREWWARFLDRYGAPFVVGKFESGDDTSRSILERAFMYATKVGGLVISRESEVEIKQAAASDSGAAFDRFHQLCNEEISKLILGQTLSAEAKATGMGSGVASAQGDVRDDIRQFDAKMLGATLSTQLAAQFLHINGLKGAPPIFIWGSISPSELKAYADFLTSLKTAGLRVADAGVEILSERFGLPLERDQGGAPMPGILPFSVRAFSAPGVATSDEEVARAAAANLAQTLGRHHARIAQIVRTSRSPADAMAQVEAYCATFDPRESARISEEVLIAYAANGSVARAR